MQQRVFALIVCFLSICLFLLTLAFRQPVSAQEAQPGDFDLSALKGSGYVVLLRHAKTEGKDSEMIDLADCATQRMLSPEGRAQVAELATRFRAAGVTQARVLNSRWCRTQETAELLALGAATAEPALTSPPMSQDPVAEMSGSFKAFLADLKAPADGTPLVLVTHSTAFSVLQLTSPQQGGGLVLKLNGAAAPEVVGVISPPQ